MSEEFDGPVGLLIGHDGYEHIVRLSNPPPPAYEVPIPQRLNLCASPDPPRFEPIPRRVFKLAGRTRRVRWWFVYNDGRSRTPEDGFVYLEQSAARQTE